MLALPMVGFSSAMYEMSWVEDIVEKK